VIGCLLQPQHDSVTSTPVPGENIPAGSEKPPPEPLPEPPETQEPPKTQEPPLEPSTPCSYESPFGFHTARMIPTSLTGKPKPQNPDTINFYEDAQTIGVAWERPGLYCHWIIIQPTKTDIENNVYHWELNDIHYTHIPESICILGNIGLPERVHPDTWELTESEKDYITFVKAVVERYDGDGKNDMPDLKNPILYWQVENEPDLHSADWKGYANIQKITYQAIKEACPECTVICGGMSGGGIRVFEKFYRPILKELNGKYIDIFDFHWYGNAFGDYKEVKPVYETIQTALHEYGYSADIWITEMGTYSGTPFKWNPQTEADQARDVIKRYIYSLAIGVKKVFWAWGLQEGFKHDNGFFDHTGFVYDGEHPDDFGRGQKKLSYYTFKKMTEILHGFNQISLEINQEIYRVTMLKDGTPVYCVWWDFFNDPEYNVHNPQKEITIPVHSNNPLLLTEAVPHFSQGIHITSYETAFTTKVLHPEKNTITFTIGETPVFLTEIDKNSLYSGPIPFWTSYVLIILGAIKLLLIN
jgi:hypothetical protein